MKQMCNCLVLLMLIVTKSYAQEILENEIVINEILFNPSKDGFDYIEGYNRSQKPLPLRSLLIGNRNSTGDIASVKLVTKDSIMLDAGQYFVITANEKWVRQHYPVAPSALICQITSMPSFPDDEGTVLLLRTYDSAVVDEVTYSEKWHFTMLKDVEGVALEKIDYNLPGADKNNWTSAANASGSGTPGQLNSQFRDGFPITDGVAVLPKLFTPDNDGVDDYAQVNIQTHDPGKIANALIYDACGRRVRYLIKNEVLGLHNRFTWDGCDDRSQRLPMGIYIICTQVFDASGNNNKFRHCIVLSNLKK